MPFGECVMLDTGMDSFSCQQPAASRDAYSSREDSWPGASLILCLSEVGLGEGWGSLVNVPYLGRTTFQLF